MDGHRCAWVNGASLSEIAYHDHEWGVPSRSSRHLFEMLVLEGAQAGLSWRTILHKRNAYRRVFMDFNPEFMACLSTLQCDELMRDSGIVRNRKKIEAAVKNARAYIKMHERGLDFSDYVWSFVEGVPVCNHWRKASDVPVSTALSEVLSKELRQLGFCFVGPRICYAFMQAVGMVNDHLTGCFRHSEIMHQRCDLTQG